MRDKSKQELVRENQIEELPFVEQEAAEDTVEFIPPPRQDPPPPVQPRGLGQMLRTPALIGGLVVLAFFGGFGSWATTAPLAGAAVAPGTVSPDTQRKTIQHLEGGIVREVNVREGSRVKAGDVLVVLLDTKAKSSFEQDAVQQHLLNARQLRYEAELALLTPDVSAEEALAAAGEQSVSAKPPGLVFTDELEQAARENKGIAEILDGERQQFHARVESYGLSLRILEQSIAKARADMVQLQRQIDAINGQARILDETVDVYEGLVKQGLESRSKLLGYKAQRAALDDDIVALEVRITADKESIVANELELRNTRASRVEQIVTDLASTRSDRQSLDQKMQQTLDTLTRTVIRAPVDGVIVNLKVHTIGGVVAPGGTVMELVPQNDVLTIDAHIDPNDIENVHAGQKVKVTLSAIPQREMPIIHGTLLNISADVLTDSEGNRYYLGKVEVKDEEIKAARSDLTLVPGMEVELFIVTKERTFVDYLLDPLMRSLNRSFVEA